MHIVADVACGVAWRLQSIHSQLPQLGSGEDDDDKTIASFPGLLHLFFGSRLVRSSTSVYYTDEEQINRGDLGTRLMKLSLKRAWPFPTVWDTTSIIIVLCAFDIEEL